MNEVQLVKAFASMEHHSQDPFNPNPAFPLWSPHAVYPNPFWGTMQKVAKTQRYFMPYIENEYLKVTIAPDIGGRIWDVYDKIGKWHLANYNVGVRSYNAGFGLNYTTGGIEINYPHAHSCTTNTLREVSFDRADDGSAAIVISELDRVWRTRWSCTFRLYPGKSYLEQHVRLYNRTPHDSRCMYWANCGFVLKPETQFIYPEEEAAMHGLEQSTFSWPLWKHHDQSLYKAMPEQHRGLYFLNAREPYFGYYDHSEHFGLCHYGDLADVPGKKYWVFGKDPKMEKFYRTVHHTLGEVYGEMQSGRLVIQEHFERMAPETECQWTERWFPVHGTGAFNGAGPGAAMRAEVVESTDQGTRLRICIQANASYSRAKLIVTSDGVDAIEQSITLDPSHSVERIVSIKGKAGPEQHTMVVLSDRTEGILARCRLRHPNERDCWREVHETRKEVAPVGTEELFQNAEHVARSWANYDAKAVFEKALQLDGNYSPARRELGKHAIWQGLYGEAIKHFESARKRDEDSLELRYLHGLALLGAGRTEDARQCFELSARGDGEARARVRLAEICMREGDWHHALAYLDRVASCHPLLTRPRGLRAACLRKLGRKEMAVAEIAAARALDAQDPFLQYEEMFIKSSVNARRLPKAALKVLIEQVRSSENPLFEAAMDYLDGGLLQEVLAVLETIPDAGALVCFVLAYVQDKLGKTKESKAALKKACASDPAYQHAWHLEMIPVLEWAVKQLPAQPRPAWHLGNLLMARRRTEEAMALWRKAESLGEKHYLLFSGLGRYERYVASNNARAVEYFLKSLDVNPKDLYSFRELYLCYGSLQKPKEAQKLLEDRMDLVLSSARLATDLLSCYLDENDFKRFDELIHKCSFPITYGIGAPPRWWTRRQLQEAVLLEYSGKLQEALDKFLTIAPLPKGLCQGAIVDDEEDRRLYHAGCVYEKMGKMEEARKYWEKALAIPYLIGGEPAYAFATWGKRYYHALSLQKLGRHAEAGAFFDAMESFARSQDLPKDARLKLLDLIERGRFGADKEKDPAAEAAIEVALSVEL